MRAILQKPLVCGIIAFLLVFSALASLCCAELPAGAQAAVDKATVDMNKVRQGLVVSLTKAQDTATKKGDLDGALAIKEEIARQNQAIETSSDLIGNAKSSVAVSGNGVRVKGDNEPEFIWDNQASIPMSTTSHTLTFFVKLPKPVKQVWIRAKKAYGDERIVLNIDGRGDGKMSREYTATLASAKEVIKVVGEHRGSNDPFAYGPLQYKLAAEDEWTDIPLTSLAPGK